MWAILTSKVAAIGFLAATVALGIFIAVMWFRLSDAQSERDAARAELAQCAENTANLRGSITVQNSQIEAMRLAGAEATARADRALTEARTAAQASQRTATAILALKPVGERCSAALGLIRRQE